jgi:hypothetical protein
MQPGSSEMAATAAPVPDDGNASRGWRRRLRAICTIVVLGLWGTASLFLMATLSASHLATYRLPEELEALRAFASAQRTTPGRQLVVHVIPETCSCTNGLFDHLLRRGPRPGTDERVVFVDPDGRRRARAVAAGYGFTALGSGIVVDSLGLQAAPVLLVLDGEDRLRYAGGYFDHPAAVDPLDVEVLDALAGEGHATPLPVFGCALDEALQRAVDPLGLTTGG